MLGDTSRRPLAVLAVGLLLAVISSAAAGPPAPSSAPASSSPPATSAAPPPTSAPGPIFSLPSTATVPQWKLEQQREVLFREGQKLVKDGQWKEALDKLREVNKIRSHPRVLLWMGFPEEQLGELLAARAIYTQAKEDAQKQKLKQEEQDADAALTALTPNIPHIIIHLPKGPKASLYLDSARITLDGEQVDVDPGRHKLSVVWEGRPAYPAEVDVKVGETKTINVPLTEPPPPPQPPSSQDELSTVPPKQGGCGCRVGASEPLGGTAALMAVGLGAALAARRRRRG